MLEMMLMGFKAGVLVADDLKEQESEKRAEAEYNKIR